MSETEKLTAFEQGYQAYYRGLKRWQWPHGWTDPDLIEQWRDGWETAMYEEQGDDARR